MTVCGELLNNETIFGLADRRGLSLCDRGQDVMPTEIDRVWTCDDVFRLAHLPARRKVVRWWWWWWDAELD